MRFIFLFILSGSFLVETGFSYPAYIAFGYVSCQTCHFNPLGNGLLRQYGRAVQATEISGNLFAADSESLGANSTFLFGPLPEWVQFQLSYRGLWLDPNLRADTGTRFIHMQAEGAAAVTFSKKLMASGSVGYVPLPSNLSPNQQREIGNIISREHYLGFTPRRGVGYYAGLMDLSFGLRVPEHTSFIRSTQLLNINDQTHGFLYHRDWDEGEIGIHLFAGKLYQDSMIRQKGVSLFSEFSLGENNRWGLSFLASESHYRSRQVLAAHGRFKSGHGSAFLAELGIFRQSLFSSEGSQLGIVAFLQSRHRFLKGVFGLMTFENYTENIKDGSVRVFRAGPSIEYLPFPKIELRLDFLGTQTMGLSAILPSSYLIQVQTHVWM